MTTDNKLHSLSVLQLPVVQIDQFYYGKLVVAPLNIVMYNVFTDHGPDLYGEARYFVHEVITVGARQFVHKVITVGARHFCS